MKPAKSASKYPSILFILIWMAVGGCAAHAPLTANHPSPPAKANKAVGIVGEWTSFGEYLFQYNESQVDVNDAAKTADIAAQMKAHPKLLLGLDGALAPTGSDPQDQSLSDRRVAAVRQALIDAGVPATRIQTGSFGDLMRRRDRRVEVLFSRTAS